METRLGYPQGAAGQIQTSAPPLSERTETLLEQINRANALIVELGGKLWDIRAKLDGPHPEPGGKDSGSPTAPSGIVHLLAFQRQLIHDVNQLASHIARFF